MLVESAHNAQARFAYFALSSVDIVIARQVLPEHDAGLYAAGLIRAKVLLFLPQFVVVIAFPDMATPESRSRALVNSLLLVGTLGCLVVLAAEALSGIAMIFVGGSDFGEVEDLLWVFAVLAPCWRYCSCRCTPCSPARPVARSCSSGARWSLSPCSGSAPDPWASSCSACSGGCGPRGRADHRQPADRQSARASSDPPSRMTD